MKTIYLLFLTCGIILSGTSVPVPTNVQLAYQDWEIGAMISFAMYTFAPNASIKYVPPIDVYNPTELNTDSWLESAAMFGAKYAVFTSKHDAGFCAWPTNAPNYTYSVKYTKWGDGKRDVVSEFVASCIKYGIKPAIYYSVNNNYYLGIANGLVGPNSTISQEQYIEIVMTHLTELWSNYGDLAELWFDGGLIPSDQGGPDVVPLIKKLQPNAMVFNAPAGYPNCVRWVGNENGIAEDPNWSTCDTETGCVDGGNGDPNGPMFCPSECDSPLRGYGAHQWFWLPDGELYVKTADRLVLEYEDSVGRNCNYMLNINPNPLGTVDDIDNLRYQQFGALIEEYSDDNAIAETSGQDMILTISFSESTYINRVIIEEDQSNGEYVQLYVISGEVDGIWNILVGNGTSIGHKRIDKFEPVAVTQVKLTVLQSAQTPNINRFALYYVGPSK